MFNTPIPLQSLSSEPKKYPWENPPKYPNPEEALIWHMERLEEPERIKSIFYFLRTGIDVVTLVEGTTRNAVMKGIHNIDVSLIISPIIHEYIVGIAEIADVEFNEGLEDEKNKIDDEEMEYEIRKKEAREILQSLKDEEEPDLEELEDSLSDLEQATPDPSVMQEETMPEENLEGLMARPQGVN